MSIPVNTEHFEQWLDTLSTTDLPQAQEALTQDRWDSSGVRYERGYCCLGVAERMVCGDDDPALEPGVNQLATARVMEWLGIERHAEYGTLYNETGLGDYEGYYDIVVDWPQEFDLLTGDPNGFTAAAMNDTGFTFKQIADVFRYFGTKGWR